MKTKKITIAVSTSQGEVSGELMSGEDMNFLYVLAHGAGAGMNHPFMEKLAVALSQLHIGTLRYNFPYMEQGKKRPDPPAVAEKAVIAAIARAHALFPSVPLLAGGKSFGGRMTSQALSRPDTDLPVKGLVFTGFPLHPMGKPGTDRAAHLASVAVPMLFLQGTRDALAEISLVEQTCKGLSGATLVRFEGADHSFKAGKTDLIPPLAQAISEWSSKTFA